jgi:ankyrin repeat protein
MKFSFRPFVSCCRFGLVALLLSASCAVLAQDAWTVAVQRNDVQALEKMLDAQTADQIDARAPDGKTALMAAAAGGAPKLLARLIAAGADPATANFKGAPAIIYAAWKGNPQVVQVLIEQRVSLEHAASNGWTAMTMASAKGNVDAIRVLIKAKALIDPPDVYGWTPLMRAANLGRLNVVKVLVSEGKASLTRYNASRQTALHLAAAAGHREIYEFLVLKGADVDAVDGRGRTAGGIAEAMGEK